MGKILVLPAHENIKKLNEYDTYIFKLSYKNQYAEKFEDKDTVYSKLFLKG